MRKLLYSIINKVTELLTGTRLSRFRIVNYAYYYAVSHLKPNFVIFDGHKIFLDKYDNLRLTRGRAFEVFETKVFKKNVKPGDVVLDIGAHIGYYTLLAARLVGKRGKVYAFEPDPANFALLKKNVQVNGYKNVILVNKAVSNKNDKTLLHVAKDSVNHTIYASPTGLKTIEVGVVAIDDFLKNEPSVNLIKMDIQGAEGAAIQGMFKTIVKNKHIKLIMELWPSGMKHFGIAAEECFSMLKKAGFNFYVLNSHDQRVEELKVDKFLKIYTVERDNYANILCLKDKQVIL